MSLIGYARISTAEQNLALQFDALAAAGTIRVFEDRGVSGAKAERPGLRGCVRSRRSAVADHVLPRLLEVQHGS
ncbi:recombinase family protein, partial [uncultured Jannaschia sp.]|uniref:recombinase family protein n=1 Tax=uncultured Jannaschia sp. TaxID=293347 RepID=UPI00260D95F2